MCAHNIIIYEINMIDQFKVVRVIQSGFTATIYEAEHEGRTYALKKYLPNHASLARQEFEIANKLSHRNIIKYISLRESAVHYDKDRVVCTVAVVEYASQGQLRNLIRKVGPMPEGVARTFFHMLISAVEHMHSVGVFHRDIKLENVLLDSTFNLKLIDFGFSSSERRTDKMIGTEGSAAPEISLNQMYQSDLADLFSCGVVLFAMIFCQKPFKTSRVNDLRRTLLAETPSEFWEQLPQTTPILKDFLTRLLQEKSNKRLTLNEIKDHPWYKGDVLMGYEVLEELQEKLENAKTLNAKTH